MKGYLEISGDPKVRSKISAGLSNNQNNLKNARNPLVGGENMAVREVYGCVTFYLIICSSSIFLTLLVQKLYALSSEEQII